jgi:hypothetical protein
VSRCAIIALLLTLALPRAALAAETDYLPDNTAWNGLSELGDLARGLQLRLELVEELDWESLPARATLFVIYPRADLDPTQLAAFLGRGGRVLIADDFGEAGPLLAKLGIRRVEDPPPRAARYHLGNPSLPVAVHGPASHALNAGVREVITNHPAAFRSTLPTLLGFDGDLQLLVAGKVGQGLLVALADPSVLLNGMLRFDGNLTLATNLLRSLGPGDGNSLYLLTGEFRVRRRDSRALPQPPDSTARFLTEYNSFLGELNDFSLTVPGLRAAGFAAGCLTLVALLTLLPLPRREPDGHWLRPRGAPRVDFEEQVRRGSGRAVRPALLLREELEEILTDLLAAPGPVLTIHPGWVVRRVREGWGAEAAELADRLLVLLRQLPASADEPGLERLSRFGPRDLAALHDLSRKLLAMLGSELAPRG